MSRTKKRRKRRSSSFHFESFLINYGLQLAGGLLIAGSLAYLLSSNLSTQFIAELLNSFSKPSSEKSVIVLNSASSLSGYLSLLLFIPGILLLIFQHFLRNNNPELKKVLVSVALTWLIFFEGKVLLDIRTHAIQLNYYIVLLSFFMMQIIATAVSVTGKSRFALNGAIVFFFVSVIMLRIIYGVILPHIILLMCLQVVVSVFCFRYKWMSPFILLMTLSSLYIFYYFVKLVILSGGSLMAAQYMMPGLLIWFVLVTTGFGVFTPTTDRKLISFIWNTLPYVSLAIVTGLCMGFFYQAGSNYVSLLSYSGAVVTFIIIAFLNRKYAFLKHEDPFYSLLCVFSAFLLPQFLPSGFFLVLSASLAVAFLINVLLTDLKISLQLSLGMYFATLGLYVVNWAFTIVPALFLQRNAGTIYPLPIVLNSLLLFSISYCYLILFRHLIGGYSFPYNQSRSYKSSVSTVHHSILYLTGFLFFDYIMIILLPGYRINLVEWGLYTYGFLYFLLASQNQKSRSKLRYSVLASLLAVILYPSVIHPETIHFRTLYLAGNTLALIPFLMHYLSLGILVVILLRINRSLRILYPKSRFIIKSRIISGILFLCFILLSEYDHLLLLSLSRLSDLSAYEILQYNKFIPYSVILLCISVILLVYSLINYTRFLRRLSMIMILAVLLKVLFVDISILSPTKSIILLITLGAILLASSFLIPWLRKQSKANLPPETETLKKNT